MLTWIRKRARQPDKTLLFLVTLVALALAYALYSGGWQLALDGFKQSGRLLDTVWLRLLMGFTLGGLIRVLIPSALIARWMGHTSGLRGILVGTTLSFIVPGAPYIVFPVVAAIYSAGAGVGPVIALLVGRSIIEIQGLLVWQIPFLGVEISLSRYLVCLFIPPLAGLAGAAVYRLLGRLPQANTSKAIDSLPKQQATIPPEKKGPAD